MAPHHPGDLGLQQALTLFTRTAEQDDDQKIRCTPVLNVLQQTRTYPEHDLICFSSSFDWIRFNSQPLPGFTISQLEQFLTVASLIVVVVQSVARGEI